MSLLWRVEGKRADSAGTPVLAVVVAGSEEEAREQIERRPGIWIDISSVVPIESGCFDVYNETADL